MAINHHRPKIGTLQFVTALSTDTKPTSNISIGSLCWETDTGDKYEFDGDSWVQIGDNGAGYVLEQGVRNLRNSTSAQNVYGASMPNAKLAIIGKTTAVTIGGGVANDTILIGLHITAALTGTCVITGFADSDGTATSVTLPAATTAGFKDFRGAVNAAGALTVTCSNAADDNLVSVLYWPTS